MKEHDYNDLITLFNTLFYPIYNTRLVAGSEEPLYLPADSDCGFHRIIFAHGFFASALHEISHWCIAGSIRRQQVDYGYWYCPDGRDDRQQSAFEVVEIKPQALDWLFCVAAAYPFHVSCDNLSSLYQPDRVGFQQKVYYQVMDYLDQNIPPRAAQFITVLQRFYHTPSIVKEQFMFPHYLVE